MKKHSCIIYYLLITFLLSFVSMLAQTAIQNEAVRFLLFGVQAASPTITAIGILAVNKELRANLSAIFHTERLFAAIFLPVVIALGTMFASKYIYCICSGNAFSCGHIPTKQLIVILWALIAEEIGWRGYLEPKLRTYKLHSASVPLIVGTIWGAWHFHYFIQQRTEVPILLFFVGCIAESYIYSFMMKYTRNILSAMIYHFSCNLCLHLFMVNPADNNGICTPYIILTALEAVTALLLNIRQAKKSHTCS
ncbi:MAG: CPBP family intramembrane metalloprotease [Ruminococcus sp.]|uniref:CPBP family intramembrane glutamic endopeptidase n=1 Tax=Ruminococcus sp. TaxID=41978 RepID=UPI0025E0393F|nr:type II CAAX endopeptidase family protein [Ruminococcus sp.]MCR5600436.1 CPBP family intramembrane metalloprotease [Ruminococcus sp.]